MRTTNIDNISALIDRLIVESIKMYFFEDDGRREHQKSIISAIKEKLDLAFFEVSVKGSYDYISEKRTFSDNVEQLTWENLEIGQADRAKLAHIEILKQELRARTANESRAKIKNEIDSQI